MTTTQRTRRRRSRDGLGPVGSVILTVVCLLMLLPVIWTILSVTKPTNVAFANPPVWPYSPTLDAFTNLWQGTYFYRYLLNTFIVAVASTVVALVLGVPAAYALSRYPGWLSIGLLLLALIFRSLPRFAIVLPLYDISRSLGIYDTRFVMTLALVAINQPFTIWLLRNFFAAIPQELDEAAILDGCRRHQVLTKIMVPLLGPGILTAAIFVFFFAFQEYLTAVVLTNTESGTVPVFIATQLGQTLPMLQQAGAAAVLLTIPVAVFAFAAQRYLVAGLSSGSVRG